MHTRVSKTLALLACLGAVSSLGCASGDPTPSPGVTVTLHADCQIHVTPSQLGTLFGR